MQEFITAISPIKSELETIKLSYRQSIKIRDTVIKSLKLRNENELRDRFEGVLFWNTFLKKVSGIMVIENITKLQFLDWELINPKKFTPIVTYNDQTYFFLTTKYGELPKIDTKLADNIVLVVMKDEKSYWVIGKAKSIMFQDGERINNFDRFIKINDLEDFIQD